MGKEIQKWADGAMYEAAPMPMGVSVQVVSATPDPLGVIAAVCKMYEGIPVGDTHEITDAERTHYWKEMQATKLKAPMEFVDIHFLITGVTRAFTHQMVRQRTAVFAQESLRFAVKENFASEMPLPPSLQMLKPDNPLRALWELHQRDTENVYNALVGGGIPAEDARGLLPHQVTTRLHYKTNLRNLIEHVGNRLCTQAQFEWRMTIFKMMEAMRGYVSFHADEWSVHTRRGAITTSFHTAGPLAPGDIVRDDESYHGYSEDQVQDLAEIMAGGERSAGNEAALPDSATGRSTKWQWQEITDPKWGVFAPACYQAGHCPFKADFDRGCTIRERADRGAFNEIDTKEWAADPTAAYVPPKGEA